MFIRNFVETFRPKKKVRDTFDWYEYNIFKKAEIECEKDKSKVLIAAGFDDKENQYFIEYLEK